MVLYHPRVQGVTTQLYNHTRCRAATGRRRMTEELEGCAVCHTRDKLSEEPSMPQYLLLTVLNVKNIPKLLQSGVYCVWTKYWILHVCIIATIKWFQSPALPWCTAANCDFQSTLILYLIKLKPQKKKKKKKKWRESPLPESSVWSRCQAIRLCEMRCHSWLLMLPRLWMDEEI